MTTTPTPPAPPSPVKVRFPDVLTKREILTIEELSGVPIEKVGDVLTDPSAPKMKLAAVLTLVGLRRTMPAATLDTVLDGEYELQLPGVDATPEVAGTPLPPPSAAVD